MTAPLPGAVRCEAKLTTSDAVAVDTRELQALLGGPPGGVGILAVLFVGGPRETDGQWAVVDATEWRTRKTGSVSVTRDKLGSLARAQPQLEVVREHVNRLWPRFLQRWADVADEGHAALVEALEAAHRLDSLATDLPPDEVLSVDHRAAVSELVNQHGESDAGRLAQDLLAYLLSSAGYRQVTLNPVGVPDFTLEGLTAPSTRAAQELAISAAELQRLVAMSEAAGDEELTAKLRDALAALAKEGRSTLRLR